MLDLGSGVAGLRVGQAYGVFHRLGFGLLVSVPRSLNIQTPFATQALIVYFFYVGYIETEDCFFHHENPA